MNRRTRAILEGAKAAQQLHEQLGSRRSVEGGASQIDVFRAATTLGATLLFRPLDGLLGAYLGPPDFPVSGIIVSTQRDLHVQRFTAAHEIGHLFMAHTTTSIDTQVGLWRDSSQAPQEVAADAFAAEFMLPRWLLEHHARRHQWGTKALREPITAYQLSLRLGASFDATCWALQGHRVVSPDDADSLRAVEPKRIKQEILKGRASLSNPWCDVWVISEQDHGLRFEGGPDDLVIFRCRERASAGYLWDERALESAGFEVIADLREHRGGEDEWGGDLTRVLITRVQDAGTYKVQLSERRPWSSSSATQLSVELDLHGKERGLPRHARPGAIEA